MSLPTVAEAQHLLNTNGFPVGTVDGIVGKQTRAGTRRFQQAYAWEPLLITGQLDGPTLIALTHLPQLSAHYDTVELRSKGNHDCYIRREQLWGMEALRQYTGQPIFPISGYRDPAHNRRIGGASISLHTYAEKKKLRPGYQLGGTAVDLSRNLGLKLNEVIDLGLFSGIGYLQRTKRVTHVDVRHLVGRGHSPANPQTWKYRE